MQVNGVMGFSVEPITRKSWQVRYADRHEVHGDDFTGALRISEVDDKTVEVCAMVTLPSREDIAGMKKYFGAMGYTKIIRKRMKNGKFEIKEL